MAVSKHNMLPLPDDDYPDLRSFIRNRRSNYIDAIIYGVFPGPVDQMTAAKAPLSDRMEDLLMSVEQMTITRSCLRPVSALILKCRREAR